MDGEDGGGVPRQDHCKCVMRIYYCIAREYVLFYKVWKSRRQEQTYETTETTEIYMLQKQ